MRTRLYACAHNLKTFYFHTHRKRPKCMRYWMNVWVCVCNDHFHRTITTLRIFTHIVYTLVFSRSNLIFISIFHSPFLSPSLTYLMFKNARKCIYYKQTHADTQILWLMFFNFGYCRIFYAEIVNCYELSTHKMTLDYVSDAAAAAVAHI